MLKMHDSLYILRLVGTLQINETINMYVPSLPFFCDDSMYSVLFYECWKIYSNNFVLVAKLQYHTLITLCTLTFDCVQCPHCQHAEGEHIQSERSCCPPQLLHSPHWSIRVWKDISCLIWRGELDAHSQRVNLFSLFSVQNVSVVPW